MTFNESKTKCSIIANIHNIFYFLYKKRESDQHNEIGKQLQQIGVWEVELITPRTTIITLLSLITLFIQWNNKNSMRYSLHTT